MLISASALEQFEKCGVLYEFVHLRGLRQPPGIAVLKGRAVDKARSATLLEKASGELPPAEKHIQLAADEAEAAIQEEFIVDEDMSVDVAKGKLKDAAVKMAATDYETFIPGIVPFVDDEPWVQKKIVINASDHTLVAILDCFDANRNIIELKTSSSTYRPTQKVFDLHPSSGGFGIGLQALFYEMVLRLNKTPASMTRAQYLWEGGGKIHPIELSHHFGPKPPFDVLIRRIERMIRAHESGVFHPAPRGAWWCSKKFCGFWDMCKEHF